jgi:hypothetical protein
MAVHLADDALFEEDVPEAWRDLAAGLADLEELVLAEVPGQKQHPPAKLAAANDVRARLLSGAGVLAEEPPASIRAGSEAHARVFAQAVLLWTRFAESGGPLLIDSFGSTTLPYFHPDFRGGEAERAHIRAALARTLGWSEDRVARLDHALRARSSNLPVKHAIAEWVAAAVGSDVADRPARIVELLGRLYGPLPLRPGDVDLVLTDTTVMFCVPYEGRALLRPGYAERPAAERGQIAAFVDRIEQMRNNLDSVRLPAFGLFEASAVDPALVAELTAFSARRPGLEEIDGRVVAATLATMVLLLASPEAEMYLVHDIWGHGWQEILCEFEWPYARLGELRHPVGAAALKAAFAVDAGRVRLDAEKLAEAARCDLRDRITLALTVVIAECLADLMEHKYVRSRPPRAGVLPSSSLLPLATLKLDLSLRDTRAMLGLAHRPYRRLIAEPADRARLVAELQAAGLAGEGLAAAVDQAAEQLQSVLGHVLDVSQRRPTATGAVRVSLAQRVMLGIVAIDAALTRFIEERPHGSLELLALLLANAREEEPAVNFWHLDELLRSELGGTFDRFARESNGRSG